MGLLLFLLNLMQNVSGWKMKPRHYLIVLFCTFWFLAWRDADRNLQSVIAQRTKDTGDLGKCSGNLQTQTALKESWQERYADQQKTINAFQGPQFQQQATLNSCVVSLGKLNPIVNTNTGVTIFSVASETSSSILGSTKTYFLGIVISTNRRVNPEGTLKCAKAFEPHGNPAMAFRHSGMMGGGEARKISDSEYYLKDPETVAEWDAVTPMYLVATSTNESIGPCSFALQQ
jgi:hypothetical protein